MKYLVSVLWLFLSFTEGHAQFETFFKRYSLEEGLSHVTVYDIAEGPDGQMWFATGYGLNRYNGAKFIVYKNNSKDPHSIFENHIRSLYIDSKQKLWIGTQRGLCFYDDEQDQFINFPYSENGSTLNVLDIVEYAPNQYILGTSLGLYSFNTTSGYKRLSCPEHSGITVVRLFNERILIGTDVGLYAYYPQSNTYEIIDKYLANKIIMAVLPHNKQPNKIWVGTEGDGLILYDISTKTYVEYKNVPTPQNSISSNFIRSLEYDSEGCLWIGTFMGLNVTCDDYTFHRYYSKQQNPQTISQNSIRSICRDTQGGMWFGAYFGGVNYHHKKLNRFINYTQTADNSLGDNIVSAMFADKDGKIWIGTNENGLDCFDKKSNTFKHYKHDPKQQYSIPGNNVKAILKHSDHVFFIGLHSAGLCLFDTSSEKFTNVNFTHPNGYNNSVYALEKGENNQLYIGTLDGLFQFDITTGQSRQIKTDQNGKKLPNIGIFALLKDKKGNIWIGTDNGMNRYNEQTKLFEIEQSPIIKDRSYCCFYEDSIGRIWIGTRSGLLLYNYSSNLFIDLADSINFPDIVIYGIQEDKFGHLWISSSNGLICFDPNQNKWITYTEADGIACNHFSFYSYCKTKDEEFYFGSIKGITSFRPEEIYLNHYTPKPIVEDLTLFNKKVKVGDKTKLLSRSISYTKNIKLSPYQSTFGFVFSVPNYLSVQNNIFAYMLDGYDCEWRYTTNGAVEYSNLKPGKYKFRLKAGNNSRIYGEEISPIEIIVQPFWWQTWWAYISYTVVILSLIITVMKHYMKRKMLKHELTLEKKDKQRIEQLNEEKIKFFINISHEFRTPLTLIVSPLYEIFKQNINDKWLLEQLKHIERNVTRMTTLVNMFLDYRRSELGVLPLQIKKGDIQSKLYEILNKFSYITESKNINYEVSYHINSAQLYYDPEFLDHIISNLISNSVKHTHNGDSIEVYIEEQNDILLIEVHDTGCGIPKEKLPLIFDQFYQINHQAGSMGIGLSLVKKIIELYHGSICVRSDVGQGTSFIVKVPCTEKAFDKKEIVANNSKLNNIIEEHIEKLHIESKYSEQAFIDSDNFSKKKILVVDDDDEIRNYLQENLDRYYSVMASTNGEEAKEILDNNSDISLVVADIMMSGINGIELCKYIKNNINLSHIPVILVTAKSDVNTQLDGFSSGADDYICKPFVFSILVAKINNIFKVRELLHSKYQSEQETDIADLTLNSTDQEFMSKAISIIQKNLDNSEFSTTDLSSELCMSRSNLYIKMKALTGESAVQFIRKVKFEYACKLLKDGQYSMAEISSMIGFSPSYFTTRFKQQMGCLPSEYIKNNNKKNRL